MCPLRSDPIHLRTNAKLNLFLRVAGQLPDGYHEIESIFHGVDLADDLDLESTTSGLVEVEMQMKPGLEGDPPAAQENLVFGVARRLIERGASNPGVRIDIRKRIPLGSGLGGGSANAAATLIALMEMWDLNFDQAEVAELAEEIGSDVPYCLNGGTALALERGGELTPLLAPLSMHFVLGLSFEPLSTKNVYGAWDEMGVTAESSSAPMALALGAGDVDGVAGLLHNDLEAPALALRPDLGDRKRSMLAAGGLGVGMSGSGPTLFAVAKDAAHGAEIAARVASDFDRVVTVTSAPSCVERLA